uniref:P-type ATPase C-terminal domain-containing protein n=1 Tax=Jaculus jaculus TaxID=51337 RepID=A0A8C5LJV7_JACJA
GVYTSVLTFFVPYGVFAEATRDDGAQLADYQSFAVTVATSLVIVVSVQIGLDTGYWTAINHFFIWGSLAVYFAILFAMHSDGLFGMFPNQFRFVGPLHAAGAQEAQGPAPLPAAGGPRGLAALGLRLLAPGGLRRAHHVRQEHAAQ